MTQRTACGSCGSGDLHQFLDLGKTPLANTFPTTFSGPQTDYPLGLTRCTTCQLVQNTEVVPDNLIYNDDYGFYSGGSQAQMTYHRRAAQTLKDRYARTEPPNFTVEIACNDGALLREFVAAGWNCLGVDPARPALVAILDNLPVLKKPFTADLAADIRAEHGPADLVVMYNALAHIIDIGDIMRGIRTLLTPAGRAVIEVQYLGDLIAGNLIGQVYHEHRYFWSLTSFQHAARLNGLTVVGAELIELQGGGIRLTLARDNINGVHTRFVDDLLDAESWLRNPATYDSMQGRVDRIRDHTLDLLANELLTGRDVVGYAAAAKATTIIHYYGLDATQIRHVIDTTPYKWGRYVPGTRIPIVPPPSAVAELYGAVRGITRFLFTSNYLAHLLRSDTDFLARGGRWLVNEPAPMVI